MIYCGVTSKNVVSAVSRLDSVNVGYTASFNQVNKYIGYSGFSTADFLKIAKD